MQRRKKTATKAKPVPAQKREPEMRVKMIPVGTEAEQEAAMVRAIRWLLDALDEVEREEAKK